MCVFFFFSVLHIKKEIPRSTNLVASGSERHEYVGSKYEVFGYSPIAFQFKAKYRGRCTK